MAPEAVALALASEVNDALTVIYNASSDPDVRRAAERLEKSAGAVMTWARERGVHANSPG